MKILIVTFDPPQNVGGIEGRARAYTQYLLKLEHSVELISFHRDYCFTSESFQGAKLSKFSSATGKILTALKLAIQKTSSEHIDCVFFLSGSMTIFGLLLLLYVRIYGTGSTIFLYGKDILEARQSLLGRFFLFFSPFFAKQVATNSRFTLGLLPLQGVVSKKSSILYPGVNVDYISSANGKGRAEYKERIIRVLFVGRLVERKGADDLLRAIAISSNKLGKSIRLELNIVGDGPDMSRLRQITNELGLDDSVCFCGSLKGEQLRRMFRDSDIFAMPSKTMKGDVEGFGTVFLEAGLFSLPSIGTRSGGIPEAISENETGILVAERNPSALAGAILLLAENQELRKEMGARAHARVMSNFSWERVSEDLLIALQKGSRKV